MGGDDLGEGQLQLLEFRCQGDGCLEVVGLQQGAQTCEQQGFSDGSELDQCVIIVAPRGSGDGGAEFAQERSWPIGEELRSVDAGERMAPRVFGDDVEQDLDVPGLLALAVAAPGQLRREQPRMT